MGRTVIIRLAERAPSRDAKGKVLPPPQLDTAGMERDLTAALEAAMRPELGDLRVVLDHGLSFKLTLEGQWTNRKEEQKQVLAIFGEVMDSFDSSGYVG